MYRAIGKTQYNIQYFKANTFVKQGHGENSIPHEKNQSKDKLNFKNDVNIDLILPPDEMQKDIVSTTEYSANFKGE